MFAGLIDMQDRMLFNRSYTTGHKAYRARSTVEIGNAIGWDNAHHVLYAGALDIAVGPRWYSTYEMACNLVKMIIEGEALHAVPYGGVSDAELAVLRNNKDALNQEELAALIDAIIRGPEPDNPARHDQAAEGRKRSAAHSGCDADRLAQVVMETQEPNNFSMPHHCYEYPQHAGLVLRQFRSSAAVAAALCATSFLNRVAWHQRAIGEVHPVSVKAAEWRRPADRRAVARAGRCRDVRAERRGEPWPGRRLIWTMPRDRGPLVERIALAATKLGNDPHNQEIAQCMLMDFGINRHPERDKLLLAAAYHTAMHRKYGDPLEPARRFGEAMGVALN